MISGISGTGKTVKCHQLELQLAMSGQALVVLNFHSTHDENQIFHDIRQVYQKFRTDFDMFEEGIAFDILAPMRFENGRVESSYEIVNGVVSAFTSVLKLGIDQKIALRKAVEFAVKNHLFFESCGEAIRAGLQAAGNADSKKVLDRLYVFFQSPIFSMHGKCLKPGHINILDLSRFDLQSQQIISELILAFLWRRAMHMTNVLDANLYVILDEVQNLRLSPNSVFSSMMKEGRKFHVSIIAATQTFEGLDKGQKEIFNQAATHLYFRQSKDAAIQVVKSLKIEQQDLWKKTLQNLSIGTCVASGNFMINGNFWDKPLILS